MTDSARPDDHDATTGAHPAGDAPLAELDAFAPDATLAHIQGKIQQAVRVVRDRIEEARETITAYVKAGSMSRDEAEQHRLLLSIHDNNITKSNFFDSENPLNGSVAKEAQYCVNTLNQTINDLNQLPQWLSQFPAPQPSASALSLDTPEMRADFAQMATQLEQAQHDAATTIADLKSRLASERESFERAHETIQELSDQLKIARRETVDVTNIFAVEAQELQAALEQAQHDAATTTADLKPTLASERESFERAHETIQNLSGQLRNAREEVARIQEQHDRVVSELTTTHTTQLAEADARLEETRRKADIATAGLVADLELETESTNAANQALRDSSDELTAAQGQIKALTEELSNALQGAFEDERKLTRQLSDMAQEFAFAERNAAPDATTPVGQLLIKIRPNITPADAVIGNAAPPEKIKSETKRFVKRLKGGSLLRRLITAPATKEAARFTIYGLLGFAAGGGHQPSNATPEKPDPTKVVASIPERTDSCYTGLRLLANPANKDQQQLCAPAPYIQDRDGKTLTSELASVAGLTIKTPISMEIGPALDLKFPGNKIVIFIPDDLLQNKDAVAAIVEKGREAISRHMAENHQTGDQTAAYRIYRVGDTKLQIIYDRGADGGTDMVIIFEMEIPPNNPALVGTPAAVPK